MITSITTGPRQSNIELLRILAMFLVLVVHSAFWGTGAPDLKDFTTQPIPSFTKTIIESISIVCVNVFILISGWFGIKPSLKGFSNFIFQCAFFLFGIYIVFLVSGQTTPTFEGIKGCFCLTRANWFIRAYAALYILSPVLNAFIKYSSQRQYKYTLIVFYIFQTIYGWSEAATFIASGYSCFSFIGLYLLARYTKIYGFHFVTHWGGRIYILTVVVNTLLYYYMTRLGVWIDIYAYVNPVVILGSLGMLTYFDKIKIRPNKYVNWVAKSSFAVFLLHSNPNIGVPVFKKFIMSIYDNFSGLECMFRIFVFLIFIFVAAIILDQPRKWLWNIFSKRIRI